MIRLAAVLLAFPLPALAGGTLTIEEKLTWPAYVWIDGEPIGMIKQTHEAAVEPGRHEVWYAGDAEGVTTYCHGVVDVDPGGSATVVARPKACEGFTSEEPGALTAAKGATVRFRMAVGDEYGYAVSVNGALAWPIGPNRTLNLTPGEHHIVISAGSSSSTIYDRGVVRAEAGAEITVTCSGTACLGLLHP